MSGENRMSFIDTISNLSFLGFDHWGYVVILFAAAFEALPLFGLFIPGTSVVMAGGFMVTLGILDIGDAVFVAATGAIIGDLAGYALGKQYGVSFLEKYGKYFFFRKEQFEKTKQLVHRHTGASLIIGRFHPLTRSFASCIAGSAHTSFGKFLLFNIVGGIAWAVAFIMVGFIFGQGYEAASRYIGAFMTVVIVASIGIVYLYRFVDKRKHIFSKYHLSALIINILSLYLFAKMVEDVVDMERITRLDIWLNAKVMLWWGPPLNEIMIFITNVASPLNLFLFSLLLSVLFIARKKWYHAALLLTGMTGGMVIMEITKFIIGRERPLHFLIEAPGYAFPSGHATMATIFFALLLYAFKDDIKNTVLKTLFISSAILTFLLVGFSRVYLNVHWLSDVLAGFALGLFWLTLLILIFTFILSVSYKTLHIIRDYLSSWLTIS